MGILTDTVTIFTRELLIFRKNLATNIARSLIFPIIFILLMGSMGNTPKNVPITVVNYDNGAGSLSFINMLQSGGMLRVTGVTNQQEAMDLLAQGGTTAVVVIPAGFSSSSSASISVYIDSSSSTSAAVASGVINSVAASFGAKLSTASAHGAGISVVTNPAYGATSNSISFTVAGILVLVATSGALMSSGFTLLSDRELGNLKAFLITPINKFSILLSKVLYGTMQAAISGYMALAVGLLYGARIASGIVGMAEILWFIFLAGFGFSCIAIAMAARMKQIQTYGLVSQTVTLPLSFLAGALVPVTSLPAFLYPLSIVDPLTYAVNAIRDIMLKGSIPFSAFVVDSAVLIVFSAVMLVACAFLFKNVNE